METIFTKIITGSLPGFVPYQTESVAVLIALEGHVLVVPTHPYKDIYELPEDIAGELMQVAVRVAKVLKSATNCDGINLIQSNEAAAGQEVFHFHLHVKPRFVGDTMTLSWDTATAPEADRVALSAALADALAT